MGGSDVSGRGGTVAAILWDLDGTLVDTERESAEAMARALVAEQGIRVTDVDREFMIGRSWVEIYRRLRDVYSEMTWSRDELIAATSAERGRLLAEEGVTVLPGALEALERFSALPLALVTGSSRAEAGQVIDALDLHATFEIVIAAEDVATSKPDPTGYLEAARHVGVAPARCLVVEDSSAGIRAGRAAGARVIAVRAGNFAGQDQSLADRIIGTLEELDSALLDEL